MRHQRRPVALLLAGCLLILPACGREMDGAGGGVAAGQPTPSSAVATAGPTSTADPQSKDSPSTKGEKSRGAGEPEESSGSSSSKGKPDEPKSDQPKSDEPKSDEPKSDEPKSDEPKSDENTSPTDADADESAQPTKSGKQTAVLGRVKGEVSAQCEPVGSLRDMRSGDFVAGPFDTARETYGDRQPGYEKGTVRLYFVPMNTKRMPGLKAKFTHVASGETVVVRQKQVADAEQWKFYDTNTKLVPGGKWRVEVSAGEDEGCFEFKLPKR